MNINQMILVCIFLALAILLGVTFFLYRRSTGKLKHEMEVMKESERDNRLLVKSIPSIVFKGYLDGTAEFVDDKFGVLTGYPVEEFNSHRMKWADIIVTEDVPRVKEAFKLALKTNKHYMREYRIKASTGAILRIRERGHIICNDQGGVDYIIGLCTDITVQHAMQETLIKMQRHHEIILNSLGEGLIELDNHGEVVFINPAAIKLLGYPGKDIIGQNLHELIHYKRADGSSHPEEECFIHLALRDGKEHYLGDDVFWTKNGEPLPVAHLTNQIMEDGQVTGTVTTFRDITWRKKAEAELKRSKQFLENIIDTSADAIGIVDARGHVTRWNKASENSYGYTFKELQGKLAFDLYADKDELQKMLIPLRRDGLVKQYEISMKRGDGSIFPASLSIKVMRDEAGNNAGSVTVSRDLTELKEKEAKLYAANEQLQDLVNESNERSRQMSLLQEMGEIFQSCQTSGETYSAIAHFGPRFFPDYAGALYLLNNSKDLYEMTAVWGEAVQMEMSFDTDGCWALRRSRAHQVADSGNAMNCRHITAPLPGTYLCVPMMAQGEVMGILHLRRPTQEIEEQMAGILQFATTVAETMALALANLKLRETLRNQAIRDGLTGLFNRRYLEETLDRELRRGKRQGSPLGVIMMDLDHFKEYNDTYGHNAGDELLVALGQTIQAQVRREDIACRYGGEEFLLIMPGASLEVAVERAQILNESVRRLHAQNQALKPITISAGVAIFPEYGATDKDVVRAADIALYRAKEEGRDRVCVATNLAKGKAPPIKTARAA